MFSIDSQTLKSRAENSSRIEQPPLLITMSGFGVRDFSLARQERGLFRSSWRQLILDGSEHSDFTRLSSSIRRAAIIMCFAPILTSILQSCSPIPEDPPEMKITLPSNLG